jgi:hypothetical protein
MMQSFLTCAIISAFFKEFSLGGQNRKKRQNEKYEPSRFDEREGPGVNDLKSRVPEMRFQEFWE